MMIKEETGIFIVGDSWDSAHNIYTCVYNEHHGMCESVLCHWMCMDILMLFALPLMLAYLFFKSMKSRTCEYKA